MKCKYVNLWSLLSPTVRKVRRKKTSLTHPRRQMNVEFQLRVYFPILPVSIRNSRSPSMQPRTSLVFSFSSPHPAPLFSCVQEAVGEGGVRKGYSLSMSLYFFLSMDTWSLNRTGSSLICEWTSGMVPNQLANLFMQVWRWAKWSGSAQRDARELWEKMRKRNRWWQMLTKTKDPERSQNISEPFWSLLGSFNQYPYVCELQNWSNQLDHDMDRFICFWYNCWNIFLAACEVFWTPPLLLLFFKGPNDLFCLCNQH